MIVISISQMCCNCYKRQHRFYCSFIPPKTAKCFRILLKSRLIHLHFTI